MIATRGTAMVGSRRPTTLAKCINTDHLRSQLDHLHAEAETTRLKANSARSRLLRLSEAAENLRRQAAISVRTGKENDARELLFQKKKVMDALEKSKIRIELLDQLSSKLNEAISARETQLIGNIALDLEIKKEGDTNPVHVISPKVEVRKNADDDGKENINEEKLDIGSDLQPSIVGKLYDLQESMAVEVDKEGSIISSLRKVTSYEKFLVHLDQQLNKIEAELVTILNVSTLILNGDEKPTNLKVHQTVELLESIHGVRQRIASFMET